MDSPKSQLYVCGSGECEQLGIPDKYLTRIPLCVNFGIPVSKVACGAMHTLVLSDIGEVFSWGTNDVGALGRTGQENVPEKIPGLSAIESITAGDSHSVALSLSGKQLYTWGSYRNSEGAMTAGNPVPLEVSSQLGRFKQMTQIVSGGNHALVLADGKVFAWGDAEFGQIGRFPRSRHKIKHSLMIESMGLKRIQRVFSGVNHSFAMGVEGKVYAWGLNNCGQLGNGTTENASVPEEIPDLEGLMITQIEGGNNHTIAVTLDGLVYGWGLNDCYQLGLNNTRNFYTPQLLALSNISHVSCGSNFTLALSKTEKVYSWGQGENYVLMNKKEEDLSMPYMVAWSIGKGIQQVCAGSQHIVLLANPAFMVLKQSKKKDGQPTKKTKLSDQ